MISSLITTCHLFTKFAVHSFDSLDGNFSAHIGTDLESLDLNKDIAPSLNYLSVLEKTFMTQIRSLIDCIQILGVSESARLASLVSQLDYNGYYAHQVPETEFIINPIVPLSR